MKDSSQNTGRSTLFSLDVVSSSDVKHSACLNRLSTIILFLLQITSHIMFTNLPQAQESTMQQGEKTKNPS